MSSDIKRPSKKPAALLLTNIRQLLTLRGSATGPRRGTDLSNLGIVEDASVFCLNGKIVSVGKTKEAVRDPWIRKNRKKIVEIDCAGKVVLPGFVDSHTHPVFISPRLVDFEKRTTGASYEEIAAAGGGIQSSLRDVRQAGKSQLAEKVLQFLRTIAMQGTTTVEVKSGYGLTLDSELKSLEAIRDAASHWPGTVVSTLLGAHIVPREFRNRRKQYVELVCREMIPQAAKKKLAQFVDVFTERGAFTAGETRKIFDAARNHNLGTRAHVCQLSRTALLELLELDPASFDHLDCVSDADIRYLARRNTIATLVPGANHFLGLRNFPPARKLIDSGVPVALATDFNPGTSPTVSMPFVMSLACTHMKMSPAESIAASTINGAWALGLQDRKGSIEPGKDADLACFDVPDYREIPYWIAANKVVFTVLNGVPVTGCEIAPTGDS
ncbi:MAG: imidazolonepropionase [Acidobacteriales bacterium]|nr:imidazolonepropionase [Terriglobales bacterium]